MKSRQRPADIQVLMDKTRSKAHEYVLARGLVQFRLDRKYMQELLELADEKGLGYGVLARMWVCERLEQVRASESKPKSSSYLDNIEVRQMVREEVQKALKTPERKKKK